MKESTLYPCVERFLKKGLRCFRAAPRVGTVFVGIADVVGVRDVGGDVRGDVEVIAVEVKTSTSNFGKIMGQALGYSLFAHKCYLATLLRRARVIPKSKRSLRQGLEWVYWRFEKAHLDNGDAGILSPPEIMILKDTSSKPC